MKLGSFLRASVDCLKPILLLWRSSLASYKSFQTAYAMNVNVLKQLKALKVDSASFGKKAVIYGCGPSLSLLKNKACLYPQAEGSFKVAINKSLFAGLDYNLALFESPRQSAAKKEIESIFNANFHLAGALPNSSLVFTNIDEENKSGYMTRRVHPSVFVLPQIPIFLPRRRSFLGDFSIILSLRLLIILSKLSWVAPVVFIRCSVVRTLILLHMLGFKYFFLVGFDGGDGYFYEDTRQWPDLSAHLNYDREIRKLAHAGGVHRTQNPMISEYTANVLIELLGRWLGFKIDKFLF